LKALAVLWVLALTAVVACTNWRTFPSRSFAFFLSWIVLTALPAYHLLLVGGDLLGARNLYLPAAGGALLLAMVVTAPASMPRRRWLSIATLLVLLSLYVAALEHNLRAWRLASEKTRQILDVIVSTIPSPPPHTDFWVVGLPKQVNGVYLHHRPAHGDLAACATNGHHLGLYWDDLPAGADAIPGVIVPRKTCALLAKHLDGVDGDAAIRVSASRVVVKWGEISIASKLIDGTFPDYERVIPRGNQLVAEISTSVIRAAVDRVTAVTGDKTRAVKLVLTANAISLVVDNPDGAASDEIDVVYAGPEVFIGFNAKYLTSTVAALEDGNVRMALANAGSPAVFTPANGGKCLAVIMPMRV